MQKITYKVGDLGSIPESEDPLEKEMATHFSIFARKIPWKRSLEGYSQWGRKSQIWLSTKPPPYAIEFVYLSSLWAEEQHSCILNVIYEVRKQSTVYKIICLTIQLVLRELNI